MPRPTARRPAPIVLPNQPMDTLWEVDESSDDLTPARQSTYASSSRSRASSAWSMASPRRDQLRSIFEDDDDEEDLRNVAFPLPPATLPRSAKRLYSVPRMTLPIHPAPRAVSAPSSPSRRVVSAPPRKSSLSPKPSPAARSVPFPRERPVSPLPQPKPSPVTPPRRRLDIPRSVSPTSSTSSSDNELPRTPPATTASLPIPIPAPVSKPYVLAPPPPAEWESAIDALFADYYDDDQEDVISVPSSPVSSTPPMPTRRPPPPPRSYESYLSFSPVSESHAPLSPSMLPMSPTFARALGSPGFMPTSPGNSDSDHAYFASSFVVPKSIVPTRPARRREVRIMPQRTTIPVEFLLQTA